MLFKNDYRKINTPYGSIVNVAKNIYWMFPASLLVQDKFQSAVRVKNISAQTYIFIAENARVIPRARNEQLFASVLVSGSDHNDISLYPEYIARVKRALQ